MNEWTYPGAELDLFAAAENWKRYIRSRVQAYIGKTVLEVGAGFGGTTRLLVGPHTTRWTCLEPDSALARRAQDSIEAGILPSVCESVVGTLSDWTAEDRFDTLLYIDVLEHIEDDRAEVRRAMELLQLGGHLVVLCPANQWLFSPFDKAIGHYRRYNKPMFRRLAPGGLELVRLEYLDFVGLFASLVNRSVMKSAMPSERQIALWDRAMVPLSRWIDPLIGRAIGKSLLGIWRRVDSDA